MAPEISTRTQLINALRLASELEHGLMLQYLFAAYSMKRYEYEGLRPDQLEQVRRWTSLITLVARQEMEHLGLALNMLSAIGGTPSFSRPNMPQRDDYYGAVGIKLALTRCDLATIKRFQRFEAPEELLAPGAGPADGTIDQRVALEWCRDVGTGEGGNDPGDVVTALLGSGARQAEAVLTGAPHVDQHGIPYRSIQELYEKIGRGFSTVSAALGEPGLFVGRPQNQVFGGPGSPQSGQMDDLNQYGVDTLAVTGLASAHEAVRLIVEQGEGVRVPPSYLVHTHFCIFTQIRREMEQTGLGDIAARPVVPNPMTVLQPDVAPRDEVTLIGNPSTLAVAELFNDCYEVMLLLLLYLYSDNVKSQAEANSVMHGAFFPFMTMFVRPLAEILTELPAFDDPGGGNAGPGFELSGDVLLFPTLDATWTLFQERLDALAAGFEAVVKADPWIGLPGQRAGGGPHSLIWQRLDFLRQNMERLSEDWKSDWTNQGRTTGV
ncbi:MAG: ferritin-like protein [Actinomycetota bacterium]|nr:ferritin-like protein [Actinomycetota bacterium]